MATSFQDPVALGEPKIGRHATSRSAEPSSSKPSVQFDNKLSIGRLACESIAEDDEDGSSSPISKIAPNLTKTSKNPDAYAFGGAQATGRAPSTTQAAHNYGTGRTQIHWSDATTIRAQKLQPFALPSARPISKATPQDRKESDATVWPELSSTSRAELTLPSKKTETGKKDKSQQKAKRSSGTGYWAGVKFAHRKSRRSGYPGEGYELWKTTKAAKLANDESKSSRASLTDYIGFVKHTHTKKRRSNYPGQGYIWWKAFKLWRLKRRECKRQKPEQQQALASSATPTVESAVPSPQTLLRPPPTQPDSSRQLRQRKNSHRKQSIYGRTLLVVSPNLSQQEDALAETSPDAETVPIEHKTSFEREIAVKNPPPTQHRARMNDFIVSPQDSIRRTSSIYSQDSAGLASPMIVMMKATKNTLFSMASREVLFMVAEDVYSDVKETRVDLNKPLPLPPKVDRPPRSKAQTASAPQTITKHTKQRAHPNLREVVATHESVRTPLPCPQHTEPPRRFVTYEDVRAVRFKPLPKKPAKTDRGKPKKSHTNMFFAAKMPSKGQGRLQRRVSKSKISRPGPLLSTNASTANIAMESGGVGGPAAAFAGRALRWRPSHPLRSSPITPTRFDSAERNKRLPPIPPLQSTSKEGLKLEAAAKKKECKSKTKGNRPHFWNWPSADTVDSRDSSHFNILSRKKTKSSVQSFQCIGLGNDSTAGYSPRGPYDSPLPRVSEDSQPEAPSYPTLPPFPRKRRQETAVDTRRESVYTAEFPRHQEVHYPYEEPRYVPRPLNIAAPRQEQKQKQDTENAGGDGGTRASADISARALANIPVRDTKFYQPYNDVLHEYQH